MFKPDDIPHVKGHYEKSVCASFGNCEEICVLVQANCNMATVSMAMLSLVLISLASATNDLCDLSVQQGLCISKEQHVVLPPAKIQSLVGSWSFDDKYILDSSGQHQHAVAGASHAEPFFTSGPGIADQGRSLKITGDYNLKIPFEQEHLQDWSVVFWVHFLSHSSSPYVSTSSSNLLNLKFSDYCPFVFMGSDAGDFSFKIGLSPKSRTLRAFSVTDVASTKKVDAVTSHARLQAHGWYHVAVVRDHHAESLSLYVNGILDSKKSVSEGVAYSPASNLFLGNLDWEECTNALLIDNLEIYNRAIDTTIIEAASFPALGSVATRFARFGCSDCTSGKASGKVCDEAYHICSSMEMDAGGYSVARKMGWISYDDAMWTRENIEDGANGEKRSAICCLNA